jgi:hypothetical protein
MLEQAPSGSVIESSTQAVMQRTFERAGADKSVCDSGSVTLGGLKSAYSSQFSTVGQTTQLATS